MHEVGRQRAPACAFVPQREASRSARRGSGEDLVDLVVARRLRDYGGADQSSTSCSDASTQAGATLTLVDKNQAAQLAPSVAADPKGCAWYRDSGCGFLSTGYFTSATTEAPTDTTNASNYKCGIGFGTCAAYCVPAGGVFGTLRTLGRGATQ